MRRSPMPPRTKRLERKTKLRDFNPDTARRQRERYAKKHRSAQWRDIRRQALARARNQCEYCDTVTGERCSETVGLDVHEVRYSKIRDDIHLDDVVVLHKAHHEMIERQLYPYRAAKRLRMRSMEAGRA